MKNRILSLVSALLIVGFAQAQSLADGLRAIDFEKYEASRDIFKSLIAKEPTNGEYYYHLGQSYLNLLNVDSAILSYNQGIKISPASPSNYAGLGELELLEENKVKAKEYFDKALSFSKTRSGIVTDINAITVVASSMVNNSIVKMLDEAEALVKMGYEQDKKNYDFLVAAGDVYLEKNDGGNAATFYERAIAVNPARPKAYTRVSVIWIRVRNYETAQSDLNRAFEKDPNYAPAWKYQAELYYAQRKFAKAKEAYTNYLNNSEPSLANQIRFSRILFLSKAYEDALEKIDEIQKTDKTTLLLYRLRAFSIAEILETKNDPAQAKSGLESLEYYMQKQEAKKITSSDYQYLGKLQSKTGDKDSLAVLNLRKAIEMNPYLVDNYTEMAKIFNKMKMFDSAAASYETYIGLAQKVTAADYYLLGKSLYYAKSYSKSDSAFLKVNEMRPEYPDAYLWRGNCNSAMDPDFESDFAKGHYEKYIELLTADPEKFESSLKVKNKSGLINAYGYLGFYYLNKDKKAEAKEYYKKVFELDPTNVKAKTVLSELK
jgi:tetratricopeptide (TPR) repeat protein